MVPSWPQVPGYALLGPLGHGAAGSVWRARREADGLQVALKVVRIRDGDPADALREAGLLARVRHLHLLHLYDVLPVPDESGATTRLALAVQLAGGGSLAQVLAARRHLTPGELVTLLVPLGGALAQLHEAGIVHGDVSPANVLFLEDGMPMLADVGVARLVGESDRAVHGTDGMVAPEVLEGFVPGPEADVYAVGALAWWCLTGETPGWVGTRADLVDLVPEVPEEMRELVQRAMSPEPDARPEAQEVAAAALRIAAPEPIEVAPDADPAVGLTRRLRAAARVDQEAGSDAAQGSGRWWRRRRLQGGPARHRAADAPHPGGRRIWRGHPPVVVVAVAALLVTVVLAVVLLQGSVPRGSTADAVDSTTTAEAHPRPDPAPPTPSGVSPPRPSGVGADAAPSTDSGATDSPSLGSARPAASEVETMLQTLVQARAAAWSKTDPDLLGRALAAGSPAIEADRVQLTQALRRGVDYEGVAFRVLESTVQPVDEGGSTTGDDATAASASGDGDPRLRVQATVRRDALTARSATGELTSTEASVDEVTLELRRGEQGWRIWSWQ